MLPSSESIINDFMRVAELAEIELHRNQIVHTSHQASHSPTPITKGQTAVYVFSLPMPSNIILKIGKVGAKSNARFQYHHYNPGSSRSNLARSILSHPDKWQILNIETLDSETVGMWIKQHTDRDNFYFPENQHPFLSSLFEIFLHCRLKPLFEG